MRGSIPVDSVIQTEDQAIAEGQMLGMSAWSSFLPPEVFDEALRVTVEAWRDRGVDPAWIQAAAAAARVAYRGE